MARSMAVKVDVVNGDVDRALSELSRQRAAAGVPQELRKRQYYRNGMMRKFERQQKSYSRAVGKLIAERVQWVKKRHRLQE